ncbi:TonB-dependent siderophore receptor [Trinickia sp.]|uniref:TonB-dependent siderophore receptor n=1 Tax=Trinickia sp. TaxID=2571163 RepID=UPI003F7FFA7F
MGCSTATPHTWAADAPPIEFHVAAGQLDKVLLQIAKLGHVVLSFNASLTRGLSAPPIDGTMTAKEALANALAGSHLELIEMAGGTLTLRRAETAGEPGAESATDHVLPNIDVRARADDDDATRHSFVVERSSTATRTDMALSDVPQSVGAVSQEVIATQQAATVADALANVSGATPFYGFNSSDYDVKVRGFQTTSLLADGMLYEAMAYPPLEGIERVEVVKGPVTLIAGGVPAGGIVNLITKKPEFKTQRTLATQIDSNGQRRASVDLAGTFGDASHLGYRFVAAGELDNRNYGGYDGKREFYLAPSLRYRDSATDITLGVEHYRNRLPILPYTVGGPDGNPLPDTPLTPVSAPSDYISNEITEVHLLTEHSFGDGWSVRARARLLRYETDTFWDLPLAVFDSAGDVGLDAIHARTVQHEATVASELVRKFKLGGVSGTLLAGLDFWRFGYANDQAPDNFSLQNLYTPQPLQTVPGGPLMPFSSYDSRQWSTYVQAQLAFGSRLRVLASLRHTNVLFSDQLNQFSQHNNAWTPNLGVSYRLTSSATLYANWLHGFDQSLGNQTSSGTGLPPMRSEQIETGVKFDLLDDKLYATAAVYRVRNDFSIGVDPANPLYASQAPGQHSRGFEFDVQGEALPGWNVIGTLTVASANADSGDTGSPGIPARSASLWSTYAFSHDPSRGWSVGGGIFCHSREPTDMPGYTLPGDARVDATIFYRAKHWSAQLGMRNVFDRRLYGASMHAIAVPVLPGRSVTLTTTFDLS